MARSSTPGQTPGGEGCWSGLLREAGAAAIYVVGTSGGAVLLIGGDCGQQGQCLLGAAARLSLVDGEHLPVGSGEVELVVVQFQLADLGVLHLVDAGADVGFDVVTRPQPAEVGALE
jgi:hypothetical protein